MNEENGKHEFNFFLDKELQQKLLEANEELLEKEFTGSLILNNGLQQSSHSTSTNKNNVNTGAQQSHKLPKYLDCVHVCGWCPNPNTVYRKSDIDAPPRSRGHHLAITRDSLFSRDSKSRPQNVDNFVFRHYSDPRKYIEQYRKEHACYDSTNSSATKTEFLETRRFYAYNQYSPLAVGANSNCAPHQPNSYVPQPQLEPPVQNNDTNSKPHHQQAPSLQYTNRREQKRNTISAGLNAKTQHQYKLTKTPPNSNKPDRVSDYTEEYIESLEVVKKQRHSGSAKERSSSMVNGLGIHKSATKINVPSANFGGKTLRTANTGVSSDNSLPSHFPGHKTNQNTTGRMLDTLACVAGNSPGGDKQPQLPSITSHNTPSKSGSPSTKKRPTTTTTTTTNPSTTTTTTNISSTIATENMSTLTTTTSTPLIAASSTTPIVTTPRIAFAYDNNNNNNNIDINNNDDVRSRDPSQPSKDCYHSYSNLMNKPNNEKDDSGSEVSISQLSTTCLGADANVKSRPKLEASRTYHVFRNEFSSPSSNQRHHHQQQQQQNQILSVVWNPSKSAVVEKRSRPAHAQSNLTTDMMGMTGPFRNSPRRPATEEGGYRAVEFITKEFIQDAKPLNLRTTDVFRDVARMGANGSPGLKTNTIKPDLPSSFSLQGVPKRPQFETLKKKRRASKTAVVRKKKDQHSSEHDNGRKSWSASTDASNQSTSGGGGSTLRLKPVPADAAGGSTTPGAGGNPSLPVPYFKFWNSSLPPKSRDGRRRVGGGGGVDKMAGDMDMQELAEMVLADESRNDNVDLADAAKRVLEFKSDAEQGIATGDSGITPSLDGPSKEILLESLRSINQRPAKSTPRPLHLTYYTGDTTTNYVGNGRRHSDCGSHPYHYHPLQQHQQCRHRHQHLQNSSAYNGDNNRCADRVSSAKGENGEEIHRFANSSNNYKNDKIIIDSSSEKNSNKWKDLESDVVISDPVHSSTASPRRLSKGDHHARKEIIFLSEKEGAEILSSAKDVNLNDDSDFLSAISDWKQIFSEHKYKDTACLIREARNKEFKHLIAKTFDQKSSLSHQRRIKHLIEQSRLKTQLDRNESARVHLKSDIGHQPVHRYVDIKTGYLPRGDNSVEGKIGSGEKVVKKKKSKFRKSLPPATRDFPTRRGELENQNYNSNNVSDTEMADGGHAHYNENETRGKEADSRKRIDKIHVVVPCGIEPDPEDARGRGVAEVNAEGYRHGPGVKVVERVNSVDADDAVGRRYLVTSFSLGDCTDDAASHKRKNIQTSHKDVSAGDISASKQTTIVVSKVTARDDSTVLYHKCLPQDNIRKLVTNNPPRPPQGKKKTDAYCSHGDGIVKKEEDLNIPLVCGTAIGENSATKCSLPKSKGCTVSSASSKPTISSPLSETDIGLLAAKMAVKINMTQLKLTHSGEMERSCSVIL